MNEQVIENQTTEVEQGTVEQPKPLKYSDSDVDSIVEKKYAKWNKENADKLEKAKKYEELLESQKSEEQKFKEKYEAMEKELTSYKQKATELEFDNILTTAGVTDKDYAKFKAEQLIKTNPELTFSDAISSLKETIPSIFKNAQDDKAIIATKKVISDNGVKTTTSLDSYKWSGAIPTKNKY